MFVGRQEELMELQEGYDSGTFQCVVLYGRRRIGKTYLISRFMEDKPGIFFTAQEVNDTLNLSHFTEKILEFFQLTDSGIQFRDWDSAFKFLADRAKERQFVLAFDEFP